MPSIADILCSVLEFIGELAGNFSYSPDRTKKRKSKKAEAKKLKDFYSGRYSKR